LHNKKYRGLIPGILILLLIWIISYYTVNNKLIIPSPFSVLLASISVLKSPDIYLSMLDTFSKAISGLLFALILGIPLGFLIGRFEVFYDLINPLLMAIRSTPVVSWLTFVILTWGIGWRAPVFIVMISLLPNIIYNTMEGTRNVDKKLLEMAKVYKVKTRKVIEYIYLGSVTPFLIASLKISLGTMWKAAIVGEYLAGNSGLGNLILNSKYYLDSKSIFVYTILSILCGLSLEYLFDKIIYSKWNKKLCYNKLENSR
jgi:NitT/TauT family transport system permease protein